MHHVVLILPLLLAPFLGVRDASAQGWQVSQGEVRVICPMTIGGSFEARSSSLIGSVTLSPTPPPILAGEFSVDLRTLDTGIGLRNDHLRNNYLEVGKGEGFDRAVLSNVDLGAVDLKTFQGKTKFTGTLLLHGTKKTITGDVQIRRTPTSLRASARFPVTISDHGIAKPRYLGVGVRNQVQVEVTFVATPVPGTPAEAHRQSSRQAR